MSCTEAEAKTRWCPFYRAFATRIRLIDNDNQKLTSSDNRDAFNGAVAPQSCCIASACMAWQWVTPEYQCLDSLNDEPEKWYLPANGWHRVGEKERCPSCMKKSTMQMLHRWRKNEPRSGLCGLVSR